MRNRKGKRERQQNNQGFSLLELLIAVIILAIIVIPFLNSFVISATSNKRAAQTHRATLAAQNIMEGFKADTLESIAWQMTYPEKEFHIVDKKLLKDPVKNSVYEMTEIGGKTAPTYKKSQSIEEVKAANPLMTEAELRKEFIKNDGKDNDGHIEYNNIRRGSIFSFDTGESYTFYDQKDGRYHFAIKGIMFQGSLFDAKITMDSQRYNEFGSLPENQQYNREKTVKIIGTDASKDAIIVQDKKMDENAILEFQTLRPLDKVKESDITRDITITVKVTGSTKPIHNVKISYRYTYKDGLMLPLIEHTAFDNSETGEELRAIYFYYLPLYSSIAGKVSDTITIDNAYDNSKSLPLDIYVIKQAHGDRGELQTNENGYKMKLTVKDKQDEIGKFGIAVHKSLRTNLDFNLANMYLSPGAPEISRPSQAAYQLNTTPINSESEKEEKLKLTDLTDKEAENRIYTIDVNIYAAGAADNNFPEADKLAELTGERNN